MGTTPEPAKQPRAWRRCKSASCRHEIKKGDRFVEIRDDLGQSYGAFCTLDCMSRFLAYQGGYTLQRDE